MINLPPTFNPADKQPSPEIITLNLTPEEVDSMTYDRVLNAIAHLTPLEKEGRGRLAISIVGISFPASPQVRSYFTALIEERCNRLFYYLTPGSALQVALWISDIQTVPFGTEGGAVTIPEIPLSLGNLIADSVTRHCVKKRDSYEVCCSILKGIPGLQSALLIRGV